MHEGTQLLSRERVKSETDCSGTLTISGAGGHKGWERSNSES